MQYVTQKSIVADIQTRYSPSDSAITLLTFYADEEITMYRSLLKGTPYRKNGLVWLVALTLIACAYDVSALEKFETRHYNVYTDITIEEVRPFAQHMDAVFGEYKRRFAKSGVGKDKHKGKESLYLYGGRDAYVAHMKRMNLKGAENTVGMFFWHKGETGVATWIYDKPRKETIQTLQHEGFHQFARRYIGPNLPLWVDEGLAVYFEQARMVKNKFKTGVAEPNRIRLLKEDIKAKRVFPINTLVNITNEQWFDNMNHEDRKYMQYRQSWSICNFLIHGDDGKYQKALNRYLALIAKGNGSTRAFEAAFKTKDYKALEKVWLAYVQQDLKPDEYSVMVDHIEYLANAALWLQNNDKDIATDLDAFKSGLQALGYRWTYHDGHAVHSKDESLYVYKDSKGRQHPFEYSLDEKTGLPIISAKYAKPRVSIVWSRVGEKNMYDLVYR